MTKERKGKILNIKLGEDKLRRIPRSFETIFRMVQTPVDDKDNPDDDETFKLHTLQTVDVETTAIVDEGRAVCINGDFDISLEDDWVEDTWREKEDAVMAWRHATDLQIKKAEKVLGKVEQVLSALRTSRDEEQY
jgi:hypothetical protein